jgi:hypothetical protein
MPIHGPGKIPKHEREATRAARRQQKIALRREGRQAEKQPRMLGSVARTRGEIR